MAAANAVSRTDQSQKTNARKAEHALRYSARPPINDDSLIEPISPALATNEP